MREDKIRCVKRREGTSRSHKSNEGNRIYDAINDTREDKIIYETRIDGAMR